MYSMTWTVRSYNSRTMEINLFLSYNSLLPTSHMITYDCRIMWLVAPEDCCYRVTAGTVHDCMIAKTGMILDIVVFLPSYMISETTHRCTSSNCWHPHKWRRLLINCNDAIEITARKGQTYTPIDESAKLFFLTSSISSSTLPSSFLTSISSMNDQY